jgi:hypothetical protein
VRRFRIAGAEDCVPRDQHVGAGPDHVAHRLQIDATIDLDGRVVAGG